MWDAIVAADARVQAALIAGIVGLLTGFVGPALKHAFDRWSVRHRLEVEYEYEERKKLRALIGKYHGRVLEAAESLNHRLWNLQENQDKGWLAIGGRFEEAQEHYYFSTTVHRLIALMAYFHQFQGDAIYIDGRIAKDKDLLLLKFAKALEWALTDVALFEDLAYDGFYATDHIFKNHLHLACEACGTESGVFSYSEFQTVLAEGTVQDQLKPVLCLLDGLTRDEDRYRWDRIVVFHLILMAFINCFGYKMQHSSIEQLRRVAGTVCHPEVLTNLSVWMKKLGLTEAKANADMAMVIASAVRAQ